MIDPKHRSYISVAIAAILGCTSVLLAWQMMCPPTAVDASRQAWKACIAFGLFKDMQTLIAAVLALLAAIIAVQPVWLQLRKMQDQTEIAARDIIDRRLAKIEITSKADHQKISEIHSEMMQLMDYEFENFEFPLKPELVHDYSMRLSHAASELKESQNLRLGTNAIELTRAVLIERARELSNCLATICAPASMAGAEYLSADDQHGLKTASRAAEHKLYDLWSLTGSALDHFSKASVIECDGIRQRIREIDDLIVSRQG